MVSGGASATLQGLGVTSSGKYGYLGAIALIYIWALAWAFGERFFPGLTWSAEICPIRQRLHTRQYLPAAGEWYGVCTRVKSRHLHSTST